MKDCVYVIDYLFQDELNDKQMVDNPRCSHLVCYTENSKLGKTLREAEDTDNFDKLDEYMYEQVGIKDEDVAFYFRIDNIEDDGTSPLVRLVPELQNSSDFIILDINFMDYFGED